MNRFLKNTLFMSSLLAMTMLVFSCSEDEPDPIDPPFAGFDFAIDEVNTLTVTFTNTSVDGETFAWDFGDGTGTSDQENPTYTYTVGGTFDVTLTVTNAGGSDDITKSLTVSGFGDNLITNGDFGSIEGWNSVALWTAADNATLHGIVEGEFMFKNGVDAETGSSYQWSNHMLYTAVTLEAGKTYKFDANVSSPSGTNGVWFEIYLLDEEPAGEPDGALTQFFIKSYGEGENCGGSAFDGSILEVANACTLNTFPLLIDKDGYFTVSAEDIGSDNTAYLIFKTGSGWGSGEVWGYLDGIFMDNVSIKEVL